MSRIIYMYLEISGIQHITVVGAFSMPIDTLQRPAAEVLYDCVSPVNYLVSSCITLADSCQFNLFYNSSLLKVRIRIQRFALGVGRIRI